MSWILNGYRNSAVKTDSGEIAYLKADHKSGKWVIVHEGDAKKIIQTGTDNQLKAQEQLAKYIGVKCS